MQQNLSSVHDVFQSWFNDKMNFFCELHCFFVIGMLINEESLKMCNLSIGMSTIKSTRLNGI